MDRGNELLKESVVMANELDVAGEFIYAAIDLRIEAEKRQEEKMKHSSK